jgi:hypothetical protein
MASITFETSTTMPTSRMSSQRPHRCPSGRTEASFILESLILAFGVWWYLHKVRSVEDVAVLRTDRKSCIAFTWAPRLWRRSCFFANYTIHRRHSQRTHTRPYEYTHANPTPGSIFEDCAGKSSRLTKSPQAPRCRRERRLPLKAQTPLNPEKFAPTRSRTQDLRCYRGSCNH